MVNRRFKMWPITDQNTITWMCPVQPAGPVEYNYHSNVITTSGAEVYIALKGHHFYIWLATEQSLCETRTSENTTVRHLRK